MSQPTFSPTGPTVLVAASSSTSVAATALSTTEGVVHAVRLCYPTTGNVGVPVYAALGSSSIAAAVPTTATPAAGMPVPAGSDFVMLAGPGLSYSWLSAVTSAGTAAPGLFATPGVMTR